MSGSGSGSGSNAIESGTGEGLQLPQPPSSSTEICKNAEIGDFGSSQSPPLPEKQKHSEIGEGVESMKQVSESKPSAVGEHESSLPDCVVGGVDLSLFTEDKLRRKERVEKRYEVAAAIFKQYGLQFPSCDYYTPTYPRNEDDCLGEMTFSDDEDSA